jgi:hypothetical protein
MDVISHRKKFPNIDEMGIKCDKNASDDKFLLEFLLQGV